MYKQLEKYLQQAKELNLSRKTIDNRRNVLYPLLDFLKNRPLTLESTQEYISYLCNKELTPASLDCYIKTIRAFVNFLELDWTKKLLRPKLHRKPLDIIPSELAEKVIITGTKTSKNKSICLCLRFILRTGLRVSEALSLTSESLNLEDETFRVLSKGGDWDILPLPRDIVDEIRNPPSGGKLFSTTPKTLNKVIQRGARRLNLKIHLTVHSLRHIFATSLLKSGVPPQIVQRLMRHKSFAITNSVYSHYVISDLANALNSQGIVREGLTVPEIFDSVEKSVKAILDKDNRFKVTLEKTEKELLIKIQK